MQTKRWTISEITHYIHQMFETDYRLQDVEIEGEVSDFRIPGSGHAYFTLKDAQAQLRCVMWRSEVNNLSTIPQHGDHIIAAGHLSVYEASGQYQLYCRSLRLAGVGDLHTQFQRLKDRLQAEGLFDEEHKQPIPERPKVIGIATSPSTAALQDVLNVLTRRYPLVRVILSPTPVQGEHAPPQIVNALEALSTNPDIDVILLVRGGGSIEDLWCFNDERVVRAVVNSSIPIISGIGHEIDFTLADFAADLRAPTPSAAAELATSITIDNLHTEVAIHRIRLADHMSALLHQHNTHLSSYSQSLRLLSPHHQLNTQRQRLDTLIIRISQALSNLRRMKQSQYQNTSRALAALNPKQTLARGYAIVHDDQHRLITSSDSVSSGDSLDIRVHKGYIRATVDEPGESH